MKKALSLVLVATVLFSTVFCSFEALGLDINGSENTVSKDEVGHAVLPQLGNTDNVIDTSGVLDLSSGSCAISDGDSLLWNEETGELILSSAGTCPPWFEFASVSETSPWNTSEKPYIAISVATSRYDLSGKLYFKINDGTQTLDYSADSYLLLNYIPTTSLQTIIVDLSAFDYYSGSVTGLKYETVYYGTESVGPIGTEDTSDFFRIKGIGVFDSEESASAWADSLGSIYINGDEIAREYGDFIYFISEDGEAVISGYSSTISGEITIPDTIDTYPVVAIDAQAFANCTEITSVTIPDSIKELGWSAFSDCPLLSSVTFGDGITSIQSDTFKNCPSLSSVNITSNIKYISPGAFYNCSGIEQISVEETNTSYISIENCLIEIQSGSLSLGCKNSIIPADATVTSILSYAFSGCSDLSSISLPDSITSVGDEAFVNCTSLSSLTLGNGITSIGYSAFYGCEDLETVSLPESLQSIEHYAFASSGISSVIIPNGVTYLGDYAFYNCTSLSSVKIGSGITDIGYYTFYGCILESIEVDAQNSVYLSENNCVIKTSTAELILGGKNSIIPANGSVTSISPYAFAGRASLSAVSLPDSIITICDYAFYNCASLSRIKMSKEVQTVGQFAFYNCTSLASVTFFEKLTDIGNYAFLECANLKTVYYAGTQEQWEAVTVGENNDAIVNAEVIYSFGDENYKLDFDGEYITILKYTGEDTDVVIPETLFGFTVVAIYDNAFYGTAVTSVDIPDTVTKIGNYAFYGCTALSSVSLGASVQSIGGYAFYNCSALAEITVPQSVENIGASAFYNCTSISKVNSPSLDGWCNIKFGDIYSNPTYYAQNLFINDVLLTEVTSSSINPYAFYNCKDIVSVTFTAGASSIGAYAFYNCTSLSSVTVTNSISSVGDCAFYNCTSLSYFNIPSNLSKIGASAFYGCSSLSGVNVESADIWCNIKFANSHSNPLYYAKYLYINGASASDITLSSIENIENNAFYNCINITSLTLPEGITSIGSYAFYGCENLSFINVPATVTDIGEYAFYNCVSLEELALPDGVASIESYTFYNCSSLSSVTFGKSISSIGSYAFYNCISLQSALLPDNISNIGTYAFYGCTSLSSVCLGNSIQSIASYAFYNCVSLQSVLLPDSVSSVNSYAFYGCSSLSSLSLGKELADIKSDSFDNCSSLSYITVNEENDVYLGIDNCLIKKDTKTLILGSANSIIPSDGTVTSIADNAFRNCSGIKSAVIPDAVESIGNYAFYNCSGLESVIIGNGVLSLGTHVFYGCSSLSSVTVGTKVTSLGNNLFYNCSSLSDVTLSDSVTSIGNYTFYGCSSLSEITLSDNIQNIGKYAFAYSGLNDITLPASIVSMGTYAFSNCSKLKDVTLSDGFDSLSNYTFYNCSSLDSVTLSKTLTSIGNYAFYGCSSLSSVHIPESVNTVGNYAFNKCNNLSKVDIKSIQAWCGITFGNASANPLYYAKNLYVNGMLPSNITIPYGTEAINSYAFYNCSSITKVVIPHSAAQIKAYAFYNCPNIAEITILSSSPEIGNYCFYNCLSISNVYFKGTESEWSSLSIGTSNTKLLDATLHFNRSGLLYVFVSSLPDKTEYSYGEELDLAGMTVKAVYVDGKMTEITEYTVSQFDPSSYGTQYLTVTCETDGVSQSAPFDVRVIPDSSAPFISTLAENSTVSDVAALFSEYTVHVLDQDKTALLQESDRVGSGNIIQIISDGIVIDTYTVLIKGDVNGDGSVNIKDVLKLKQVISGKAFVQSEFADINEDGQVDETDICTLSEMLLNK